MAAEMWPAAQRRYGIDIVEPRAWPFDWGARREAVRDPNWNDRIIRRVGWTRCMRCGTWFFSPDVAKVRLHGEACSSINHDML